MLRKPAKLLLLLVIALAFSGVVSAQEKVIMDTDFNTLGDDGQVLIMLAQLHAEGKIDLLGVTVVSGNQWLDQGVADALKAVERMGIEDEVPVLVGAEEPLVHDYDTYEQEKALFGFGYPGAWGGPRPSEEDLVAPPDGFAENTEPAEQNAVEFIIDQVNQNPGEATLLVIGPATNVALAIRQEPEIVDKIKRIVYMGGAIDVPGNVTPAAEFNWWFDPEAAKIVLREPIEQVVVPLDVTNTVQFGQEQYDRIVNEEVPSTAVTELFRDRFESRFAEDPEYQTDIWDTITVGYLVDPSIVTDMREVWIDMDDIFGPNYGRSIGYYEDPPVAGLQKVQFINRIDNDRFWDLYVDLMTRPVPVQADAAGAAGDGN